MDGTEEPALASGASVDIRVMSTARSASQRSGVEPSQECSR